MTDGRRKLRDDLEQRPDDEYLLGAVPEYDGGGDQEAELCTCGGYGRAVVAQSLRTYAELVEENLDDDRLRDDDDKAGVYPVVEDYQADADRIASGEAPVHEHTLEVLHDDTGPLALLEQWEVEPFKAALARLGLSCPTCGSVLLDWHPASRADGKVEGTCPEHGHVVAA